MAWIKSIFVSSFLVLIVAIIFSSKNYSQNHDHHVVSASSLPSSLIETYILDPIQSWIVNFYIGNNHNESLKIALFKNININNVLNQQQQQQPQQQSYLPKVWSITPNSTGLIVDAMIYEEYLGSNMSFLSDKPPHLSTDENQNAENDNDNNNKDITTTEECVYIFLEMAPTNPNADLDLDWKKKCTRNNNNNDCRVMVMANTDQFTKHVFDTSNLELILCKTRQCVEFIRQQRLETIPSDGNNNKKNKESIPIVYTGFTSFVPINHNNINNDDDLSRFDRFLHVAGQSPHKGTMSILQAWLSHPHWPTITITSYNNKVMELLLQQIEQQLGMKELPSNIHHINTKLSRHEMDDIMWNHGIHVCLSGMEGFGHYINEARAVGAMVITTNYPAMNELITSSDIGIMVEPTNMLTWTNSLPFANVAPTEIIQIMNQVVLPMPREERAAKGQRARLSFEKDQQKFQERANNLNCYIRQCGKSLDDEDKKRKCAKLCGLIME